MPGSELTYCNFSLSTISVGFGIETNLKKEIDVKFPVVDVKTDEED